MEAAGAYNSFITKLNAVHRLATASHGTIELIASLKPRNRLSGGGGAWITASVEVVMIVRQLMTTMSRSITSCS